MPLHTPLCDLLGIEHAIVQGPLGGPWNASVELVAAVSNAGGLGSIAAALKPVECCATRSGAAHC